jgi:hypothetical protein
MKGKDLLFVLFAFFVAAPLIIGIAFWWIGHVVEPLFQWAGVLP